MEEETFLQTNLLYVVDFPPPPPPPINSHIYSAPVAAWLHGVGLTKYESEIKN